MKIRLLQIYFLYGLLLTSLSHASSSEELFFELSSDGPTYSGLSESSEGLKDQKPAQVRPISQSAIWDLDRSSTDSLSLRILFTQPQSGQEKAYDCETDEESQASSQYESEDAEEPVSPPIAKPSQKEVVVEHDRLGREILMTALDGRKNILDIPPLDIRAAQFEATKKLYPTDDKIIPRSQTMPNGFGTPPITPTDPPKESNTLVIDEHNVEKELAKLGISDEEKEIIRSFTTSRSDREMNLK